MPLSTVGDAIIDFLAWAKAFLSDAEDAVTGSIGDTLDAIVSIVEMDCNGEWVVYVKTAVPAIGDALYLFIVPSFGEILENYLEPKPGRRGGRRGRGRERENGRDRRGRPRRNFRGGIPDVDELIAERILGRAFFRGRQAGPLEHVFWTGINVADRVLWNWLLLKAGETLATSWQSGLLESGQCIRPGEGACFIQSGIMSGWDNQNCWGNILTEPVVRANNMEPVNSGRVNNAPATQGGGGHVVITTKHTFENTSATSTLVVQVGFKFMAFGAYGGNDVVVEKGQTLSVPPNSTNTIEVTGYAYWTKCGTYWTVFRFAHLGGGAIGKRECSCTYSQMIETYYRV